MRKRIISLLLVFCMLCSMLPATALAAEPAQGTTTAESTNPFHDVTKDDWFYTAVEYARANGFFNGTTATTFGPNVPMTRGMFVTVLARMAGVDGGKYKGSSGFSDVAASDYYAPYVAWAAQYGITSGVGDGKFNPNGEITRQQMAVFFVNYFEKFGVKLNTQTSNATLPADFEQVADWAKPAVQQLWQNGLMVGDGKRFEPDSKATRAQVGAMCRQTDKSVQVWYSEPGVPSTRVSVDPETLGNPGQDIGAVPGSGDSGSSGSSGGGTSSYAVSFYDGARLIETLYAQAGQALGQTPSVEKYSKENAILLGWYTDPGCTTPFYAENPVNGNLKVYAKYQEMGDSEIINLTSYAQMDQEPDLSFAIRQITSGVAAQSAAELTVKDGSDPVALTIEDGDGDGVYTVKAEDGFNKGCSYELTLAEGWIFVDPETGEDKPETIRTASFSIKMEEVDNLKMSGDIKYIQDTDSMDYLVGGSSYEELKSDLVTAAGGSFQYDEASLLKPEDVICVYVGVDPRERTADNGAALLDPAVYVKVQAVNGTTVTFAPLGEEEQQKLYEVPDNFPILVSALPEGAEGTVNISALDTAMYATMMGEGYDLAKAKESIAKGDFVTLYVSQEGITGEESLYYGEVTDYDPATGEITYQQTTREAILNCMDLYADITISGDDLITPEERAELEATLQAQVENSGFAEEAAYAVADLISKTDNFRENMGVREFLLTDKNGRPLSDEEIELLNLGASFELSDDIELKVELITSGDQLHFGDSVQMAIGVKAELEVDAAEGKVAIDLNATFVQEVMLDPKVKGNIIYKEILFIPVPVGVRVGATMDIKSYTALSFSAEIYTVAEEDKPLWERFKDLAKGDLSDAGLDGLPDGLKNGLKTVGDAMDKIDELKNKIAEGKETAEKLKGYAEDIENLWNAVESSGGSREEMEGIFETLGKTSITSDLLDMLNLTTDTELTTEYLDSMQALMDKYSEMLEKETDWITLVEEEITTAEMNFCGLVVGVEVDFVVRADMSLAIGSNLEYEVGKRYNFWFEIRLFSKPEAGSDSMDLIDEHFAFQFYVMGKLGVKAGVRAKLYVGLGTGKFASVGITTELGPYIKLYGFFIYEFEKYRPANTQGWTYGERMAGALYLEFGLYFILGFEANFAGDLFEYSHDFLDLEFPLLYAGDPRYYYGSAYEPAEDEMVIVRDEDGNSTNGITMTLPGSTLALSYIDLDTGVQGSEILDYDQYNYILSNPNFSIDQNTGLISVTVPENTRYMECDLTVTYLHGKLAFSQWDMSATVPLVWTNLSDAELSEYYTASVRVGNDRDGYQTVWNKRVLKNQPFDLPTEEEIKDKIGWNDYKYIPSTGYGGQALENLTLIEDKTYDYQVGYKTYDLTVDGIQNADGSTRSETYTARFGETFDFSDLLETGTVQPGSNTYTKFAGLTTDGTITVNGQEEVLDLTQRINSKFADALLAGASAQATYVDNSAKVTFTFTGLDHEDMTYTIQKGTEPSLAEIEEIVSDQGLAIKDISPAVGKVKANTVYQVICGELTGPSATITFHANGGSEVAAITKVEGSLLGVLPEPTKTGYTFEGWYTDDGTFQTPFTARKMPTGGAELYAKWTAKDYTVTFNVNGGNALEEGQETKSVTYGGVYGELPVSTKSGSGFIGWFTEKEGGEQVTAETPVAITANQTLYAQWKPLKEIPKAVFDFGEAEGGTYAKGQYHEVEYTFAAEEGETYQRSEFTVKYMRQGNSEYEAGLPINAGTYNVTISRPADNDYAKFEQTYTAVITVDKAIRSPEAFANADIIQENCGLNYIEVKLDPSGIDDFSIENTKVIFTIAKVDGNLVIPSEGGSSEMVSVTETVRFNYLLPDTVYGVNFRLVDDPNYYDYTYEGYLPRTCPTLSHNTDTLWTDYAEAFAIDEETKAVTIENEGQLAYLAKTVNEGTNYAGYTFTLARDMRMLDHAWTPIGKLTKTFGGVFDGNGYTIYGLHTSGSAWAGLFGATCRRFADFMYVKPVIIQNLTLAESYVSGTQNTGAIVGYADRGTHVLNCVNEATVVGLNTADHENGTGGIAGYVYGGTSTKIERCINNGRVDGICQTGGIAGNIDTGLVVNNINNGPVKGTNNHTGGILGYVFSGNVMNNVNFGSVTGVSCVGGIAGQVEEDGWVLNCYTTGTIKGTVYYVGAAIGRNVHDDGVTRGLYYLKNSATCNGSYRNASGTRDGSMYDGDTGNNLSAAYFTSPTEKLSRNADCGDANLLDALNTWVKWWNDYQCNAWWEKGPDGYPLPTGETNTEVGTKR